MSGAITESLRNIELVKSLGLTYPEIRRMKEYTQKIFDLEMKKVKQVRFLSFLQGTTLNLLRQSILFTLLWLIFRHVLSPARTDRHAIYIDLYLCSPAEMGNIILSYREAEASIQLFDELMKKPVEHRPESPVDIGTLSKLHFDQVVFRHQTASQNAIDNISFEASSGKRLLSSGPRAPESPRW